MSELSYKELQEQGVFDVPYKAFKFMENQQKEINDLREALSVLLKSYNAQKSLPMLDEFNRGWVSAYACVASDLEKLVK